MTKPNLRVPRLVPVVGTVLGLLIGFSSRSVAAEDVTTTEITPNVLVFATSTGNVVASVGPDCALLIGTPSKGSTEAISNALGSRTKSSVRYVVIGPENPARSEGDAGWGQRGAFVAMQEKALERFGGHHMGGGSAPMPPRLLQLGVDRPRISFDHVLSFDVNGEAVHVIHQAPAFSDGDAVTHFHHANVIYLGEVFPGDGYPEVDASLGGKLQGIIDMLGGWTDAQRRIVPARGKVTDGAEVGEFRTMIVTVRDRVQKLVTASKSEDQVIAEHPTAEFDARWGHGRVSPDAFVKEVYAAVKGQE
jgi:cyclase